MRAFYFYYIFIIYTMCVIVKQNKINQIIREELSKSDVNSLIQSKISSEFSSRDFEKRVKEITANAISELFKALWQRDNFWKSSVSR